jgi:hypothetical protein
VLTVLPKSIALFSTNSLISWLNSAPDGNGFYRTGRNGDGRASISALVTKNAVITCPFRPVSGPGVFDIPALTVTVSSPGCVGFGESLPVWPAAAHLTEDVSTGDSNFG